MIYVIMLSVIYLLYLGNKKHLIRRRTAITIISILLILMAGLRNPSMGMKDTLTGYLPAWHIACRTSLSDILTNYVGSGNSGLKDIGFAFYLKFLSLFSDNDQFFLTMTVVLYIYAVSHLIYKRSDHIFMSYFLFIGLNLYTCSFYIIRHVMAAAFLILSIDYIYEKKLFRFTLLVCIGATFHSIALIFLLAYPAAHMDLKRNSALKRILGRYWYVILIVLSLGVVFTGKDFILRMVSIMFSNTRFETAGGGDGGLGRFLLSLAILLFCTWKAKKASLNSKDNNIQMMLSLSTCILYAFMPVMADFHRCAKFFEIINVIYLPNTISRTNKAYQRALEKLAIYIVIGIYMFTRLLPGTNALPFLFYWDN